MRCTAMSDDGVMVDPESPAGGSAPGMPRWVKVFAAVLAVVILALVVAFVVDGGGHGPGMHG